MDNDTAQAQATEIQRAYLAASRPLLPRSLSVLSAACAGVGVALLGQPGEEGPVHLAFMAAGVLLMAAAHMLPTAVRRHRGLHGYRGWTRTENTSLFMCALVLVICGFSATGVMSPIFIGVGVVVAVPWYLLLRGRFSAGGRPAA